MVSAVDVAVDAFKQLNEQMNDDTSLSAALQIGRVGLTIALAQVEVLHQLGVQVTRLADCWEAENRERFGTTPKQTEETKNDGE